MKDKIALVTGAASGIGLKIAETFASAGATVIIADLNFEGAQQAAQKIVDQGQIALPITLDVTNEEQVNSSIKKIVDQLGSIDILVSNAGYQHIDPIDQLSFSDWKTLLAVHLDGAFLTTRACLQYMYKSGRGGQIIYMGSIHSKSAAPLKGPYVVAKHGLLGLCKVVALEGAKFGVRANILCPGYVLTPLVEKQIPELAKRFGIDEDEITKSMLAGTADNQFTTVEEVAEAALFIASFDSNALTGQSLIVSHGRVME